jgi:hypothetical protein
MWKTSITENVSQLTCVRSAAEAVEGFTINFAILKGTLGRVVYG